MHRDGGLVSLQVKQGQNTGLLGSIDAYLYHPEPAVALPSNPSNRHKASTFIFYSPFHASLRLSKIACCPAVLKSRALHFSEVKGQPMPLVAFSGTPDKSIVDLVHLDMNEDQGMTAFMLRVSSWFTRFRREKKHHGLFCVKILAVQKRSVFLRTTSYSSGLSCARSGRRRQRGVLVASTRNPTQHTDIWAQVFPYPLPIIQAGYATKTSAVPYFHTFAPETLSELMGQRRRWQVSDA